MHDAQHDEVRDAPVASEGEFAVWGDAVPFVREVRWEHPLVRAAMRGLGPTWRSLHAYPEWRVPFGLEDDGDGDPRRRRDARVRNFMRVLVGEYRDHPRMLAAKLAILARQRCAGSGEMDVSCTQPPRFEGLTHPAYARLVALMETLHTLRAAFLGDAPGEAVPPWTEPELAMLFAQYLGADAPRVSNDDPPPPGAVGAWRVERARAALSKPAEPPAMYTFRGHIALTPLWLESNAFLWNARRAGRALHHRGDGSYYQRPFASRLARARAAWGAWLFHREEDDDAFRRASEPGGGPVLYVTDQDVTAKGLADYRLFVAHAGAGEATSMAPDPARNANMVAWARAAATPSVTAAMRGWRPELLTQPDLGFEALFPALDARLARLRACLDRHTNWGPTGYYMLDASPVGAAPEAVEFLGAYSPLVATSYDLSASHAFASRDGGDPYEAGHPRWIHVVRFDARRYVDAAALRAGRSVDFARDWFSEASLSSDPYDERGLTRFGWVPEDELAANLYMVYGARGDAIPPPEDIPAP